MSTTTNTLPARGTAVMARPWHSGNEAKRAIRGLVVDYLNHGEYVVVWFPKLGTPADKGATQGILASKISQVTELADCPPSWVVNTAYRYAKRTKTLLHLGTAAGMALEAAAKAHHRAYVERQRAKREANRNA